MVLDKQVSKRLVKFYSETFTFISKNKTALKSDENIRNGCFEKHFLRLGNEAKIISAHTVRARTQPLVILATHIKYNQH